MGCVGIHGSTTPRMALELVAVPAGLVTTTGIRAAVGCQDVGQGQYVGKRTRSVAAIHELIGPILEPLITERRGAIHTHCVNVAVVVALFVTLTG